MTTAEISKEEIRPPQPPGSLKWLRDNLFGSVGNTIITLILLPLIFFATVNGLIWVFSEANWTPVISFPMLYAVGQYLRDQVWRVGIGLSYILFVLGLSWGKWNGLLKSISIAMGLFFALFLYHLAHYCS